MTVGRAVACGAAEYGIALCGNGVGVTVGANKVANVRAALCLDTVTAHAARTFIDANVLTMGFEVLSPEAAVAVAETFLTTTWNGAEASEIETVGRWEAHKHIEWDAAHHGMIRVLGEPECTRRPRPGNPDGATT